MTGVQTCALPICSQERNRSNFSSGRSKSKGRSKSIGKFGRVCWRCGKEGHYKKQCRSKFEKKKGSEESSSTEENTSKEEGGDVYLASSSTHADHEAWFIDSGASFHMTPHRDWFCEYEKYDGGNVFLGNDSTTRIIGKGRVKLRLIDGRIITTAFGSIFDGAFDAIATFYCRKTDKPRTPSNVVSHDVVFLTT